MTSDATDGRRPAQAENLTTKAGKVHKLVLHDSVRERFRQQCRLFYDKLKSWWRANDAYETAYRQLEKVKKRGSKGRAKAEKELHETEARLRDLGSCPMEWLHVSPGRHMAPNKRDAMEYMFPDSDPVMTAEAVRLRSYVLLTIIHDHALNREVRPIADKDVWPRDYEAVPEDFALNTWKNMEANPSWSCGTIDRALCIVQADGPPGRFGSSLHQTNAERKSDRKPPAVSLWDDIPREYRDAIEQYQAEAYAASKKKKRVKISLFCLEHHLNEAMFRNYQDQVRKRKKRYRSEE